MTSEVVGHQADSGQQSEWAEQLRGRAHVGKAVALAGACPLRLRMASSSGRISRRPAMTVTNEAPLIKNVEESPAEAMRTPATAGPTTFPVCLGDVVEHDRIGQLCGTNHLAGEGLPRRLLECVDDAAKKGEAHDASLR